jgi:hypothetical protein
MNIHDCILIAAAVEENEWWRGGALGISVRAQKSCAFSIPNGPR